MLSVGCVCVFQCVSVSVQRCTCVLTSFVCVDRCVCEFTCFCVLTSFVCVDRCVFISVWKLFGCVVVVDVWVVVEVEVEVGWGGLCLCVCVFSGVCVNYQMRKQFRISRITYATIHFGQTTNCAVCADALQ